MTAAIPAIEPTKARAGETWKWTRDNLTDYPAPTWTLKYWFKKTGATAANFSISATADGADHAVSVAAATTAAYTAGDYTWSALVSAGAEIFEIGAGRLKILPRYDAETNVDDRTHARKMLEAIEAELEGKATAAQSAMIEYAIGGRSYKRDRSILIELREKYLSEVRREEAAQNLENEKSTGGRLLARL